jgi:Flp pilus assembly pilin Flp
VTADQTSPSLTCPDRNPRKGEQMKSVIRRFYEDESGASSVEYAILVSSIAVAIMSAVALFGQGVKGLYTQANTKFP